MSKLVGVVIHSATGIWEEGLPGDIQETPRRHPGGTQETPRRPRRHPLRHPEAPRGTQEAPRRIRA